MSAADDQISDARLRMLGSVPGAPALGRGPAPDGGFSRHEYDHPAAGWGAARSVGHVLETRGTPAEGIRALDMKDRGLGEFDLVDITSFSRDGSRRTVYGYRAIRYEIPRGCAAGYMPGLNVLCGIADYSSQSGQPVTKHLEVEVIPAPVTGAGR